MCSAVCCNEVESVEVCEGSGVTANAAKPVIGATCEIPASTFSTANCDTSVAEEFEDAIAKVKAARRVKESKRGGKFFGFNSEGPYTPKTHKRIYTTWRAMINRTRNGYCSDSDKYYSDCSVHETFLDFQKFAAWYESQVGGDRLDFQIDKDIMQASEYGEDTCLLIPREINVIFRSRAVKEDACIGVVPIGSRYRARSFDASRGKFLHLAVCDTQEEAFYAYKKHREAFTKALATEWYGKVDQRAINALLTYEVHPDGTFTCNPYFESKEQYEAFEA